MGKRLLQYGWVEVSFLRIKEIDSLKSAEWFLINFVSFKERPDFLLDIVCCICFNAMRYILLDIRLEAIECIFYWLHEVAFIPAEMHVVLKVLDYQMS